MTLPMHEWCNLQERLWWEHREWPCEQPGDFAMQLWINLPRGELELVGLSETDIGITHIKPYQGRRSDDMFRMWCLWSVHSTFIFTYCRHGNKQRHALCCYGNASGTCGGVALLQPTDQVGWLLAIISCQNINKNPFCWTRKLYRASTIDFWRPHLKPSLSPRSGNPDVWISRNGFLDSLQQLMRRKTIAPDTLLAARKAGRWPQQIVAVLRAEMTFNSLELLSTLPRDVRELVVPCWP